MHKHSETKVVVRGWKGMHVTVYIGQKGQKTYFVAKANCGESSCGQKRFESLQKPTVDEAVNNVTDMANAHIRTVHNDFKSK